MRWLCGRHVELATLDRIFHVRQVARRLNRAGYVRYHYWHLYGEEAAIWLFKESLTIAFAEEPLAQYTVTHGADGRTPAAVAEARLLPSCSPSPQPPLWDRSAFEWHRVIKLPEYTRRRRKRTAGIEQRALFA